MTITADTNGVVSGSFTIPANIPSGTKRVAVVGSGGSFGETFFEGRGEIWEQTNHTTYTQVTTTNVNTSNYYYTNVGYYHSWYYGYPRYNWRWWKWGSYNYWYWGYWPWGWYDPLAQTFRLDVSQQIGAVELFVRAKGNTPVQVSIRRTENGVPTDKVLQAVEVEASTLTTNQWNRWVFPEPCYLEAGEEYAIVAQCNDADTELAVAELGKWDSVAGKWITSQPYTVGTMLSSSNASSWTVHQEKDLAFRLLAPRYATTSKTISLGTVALTNATDLMLVAEHELPSAATSVSYTATLPNGTSIQVNPKSGVQLTTAVTGNVALSAQLTGAASATPIVNPGAQLISGQVATSATYVSRAITCGSNARLVAVIDAAVPTGATMVVEYKGVDAGDTWTAFPAPTSKALSTEWAELTFEKTGVSEDMVQLRITLTGNTAARPKASNLRFYTT